MVLDPDVAQFQTRTRNQAGLRVRNDPFLQTTQIAVGNRNPIAPQLLAIANLNSNARWIVGECVPSPSSRSLAT